MKLRLPKIKIHHILIFLKYSGWIVMGLIFAGLIYLISFLYNNFYLTINHSEQIIVLKNEVSPFDLDYQKFQRVTELIEKKTSGSALDLENIKNPFNIVTAPPPVEEAAIPLQNISTSTTQ